MRESLRALIVDTQAAARARLRSLLAEHTVDVAGEAGDGLEAVSAVLAQSPDLVFLDVHLPKLDAFEVIDTVGVDRMPPVVFVASADHHAFRAFEVHAVDYLLKPCDADRLHTTLERARRRIDTRHLRDLSRQLRGVIQDLRSETPVRTERLVIKSGGRTCLLRVKDIDWIEASGNLIRFHAGPDQYAVRDTMNRIETRLNSDRFVRIHRCAIVNLERIREFRPTPSGEYVVLLRCGAEIAMSRGYRERLQEQVGRL
jgi:two-component system LytT family response regulator